MLKVLYLIFQDYGFSVFQLFIIIGLCSYIIKLNLKILNNHLAHIQTSLDELSKKVEDIEIQMKIQKALCQERHKEGIRNNNEG